MDFKIRAKKAIKRIAAITTGAVFLGATLSGALAMKYSISVDADSASATKLATGVSTSDKVINEIGIGAGITNNTQPKDYFDTPLEDDDLAILQDTTIQYNNGDGYDDYDVSDQLWFGADSPSIETALSTTAVDTDYKSDVAMEVAADSIFYYFSFDESINISQVTEDYPVNIKFFGKDLKITGVSWNDAGTDVDGISVKMGENYYMNIGDTVSVDGHTVKLEDVADGVVGVSVDGGAIETIDTDESHSWAEGIEVNVDSVFYKSGAPETSTANLIIGKDATKTYSDGDEYIGEEENDEYWRWDVADLEGSTAVITTVTAAGTATGPTLALQNYFVVDDSSDADPAPVLNKGCYDIPTKDPYAQLCIDGLTVDEEDYMQLDIEITTEDLRDAGDQWAGLTSAPVIKIKSNKADSLKTHVGGAAADEFGDVDGGINPGGIWYGTLDGVTPTTDTETDTLYLAYNNTNVSADLQYVFDVFYVDSDNDIAYAGYISAPNATDYNGSFAYVNFGDTKDTDVRLSLAKSLPGAHNTWYAGGGLVSLVISPNEEEMPTGGSTTWLNDNISIPFWNSTAPGGDNGIGTSEADSIGDTAALEQATDITYNSTQLDAGLGTQQEDLRTMYGIIIKDPELDTQDDDVTLLIPGDAVRAKVTVGAYGAIGASFTDEAKLATEVTTVPAGSIIVGGPAANEWAAKAMGKTWPTYGDALGWSDGWCFIKDLSLDSATVTVIAGYDAQDTAACVDKFIAGTKSNDGVLV